MKFFYLLAWWFKTTCEAIRWLVFSCDSAPLAIWDVAAGLLPGEGVGGCAEFKM